MRSHFLVFALTIAALLSGCHKYKTCPAHYLAEPPPPTLQATGVLFATDREPKSLVDLTFSAERNLAPQRLTYGVKCEDPEGRKASCTEGSSAFPDSAEFFRRVNTSGKDVVLFIHGYRYSFDESLQIAARLVQRSKVDALPVAYSWPSQTGSLPMEKTTTSTNGLSNISQGSLRNWWLLSLPTACFISLVTVWGTVLPCNVWPVWIFRRNGWVNS